MSLKAGVCLPLVNYDLLELILLIFGRTSIKIGDFVYNRFIFFKDVYKYVFARMSHATVANS